MLILYSVGVSNKGLKWSKGYNLWWATLKESADVAEPYINNWALQVFHPAIFHTIFSYLIQQDTLNAFNYSTKLTLVLSSICLHFFLGLWFLSPLPWSTKMTGKKDAVSDYFLVIFFPRPLILAGIFCTNIVLWVKVWKEDSF